MCRGDLVEQVVLVTSRRSGQHLLELLRGDYIYLWPCVCVSVRARNAALVCAHHAIIV